MKVLKSLALATAIAAGAASAHAATYAAYDQFQLADGALQTGDFAVGYFTGTFNGSITPFSTFQTSCGDPGVFCAREGESSVSKAYTGTYDPAGTHLWEAGFLNMHPGVSGQVTVLQFVAPTDGAYNFAGSYKIHDTNPTGVDIRSYVGTTNVFGQTLEQGSRPFDFDATLAAGERVSFLLGAAGNYTYDSTGIALTVTSVATGGVGGVPEPATWAMMLIGFFGTGATLRSRHFRRTLGVA